MSVFIIFLQSPTEFVMEDVGKVSGSGRKLMNIDKLVFYTGPNEEVNYHDILLTDINCYTTLQARVLCWSATPTSLERKAWLRLVMHMSPSF